MIVGVGHVLVVRVDMVVRAVLAGMLVFVRAFPRAVLVGMLVLVFMFMGMDMDMLVGVLADAGMLVFVLVFVGMLVAMVMVVFVVALHDGCLLFLFVIP
ncbi:hypothetical protein K9F62_02085 [Desulfovibrio sp. JY]|nr:hypothetical protein K9F62_02085 [Desulfovibrio sp. JY]